MVLLLWSEGLQVVIELIEVGFPEPAVLIEPFAGIFECRCGEPAWTPLCVAVAHNQSGVLEHLQVLGDGGEGHVERFSEFRYRGLAPGEPGQDGTPGWIGECCESRIEKIGSQRAYLLVN
jgi:hypothetical protein